MSAEPGNIHTVRSGGGQSLQQQRSVSPPTLVTNCTAVVASCDAVTSEDDVHVRLKLFETSGKGSRAPCLRVHHAGVWTCGRRSYATRLRRVLFYARKALRALCFLNLNLLTTTSSREYMRSCDTRGLTSTSCLAGSDRDAHAGNITISPEDEVEMSPSTARYALE